MVESSNTSVPNTANTFAPNTATITISSTSTPNTTTIAISVSIPNINHFATKIILEGPNYMAWVYQFRPILRMNDLMGIVDSIEPCPPKFIPSPTKDTTDQLNPNFILWEKKDQYLLSWFIATLSDKVFSTVYGLETSRQVWTTLANRYVGPSKTRIQDLRRQLQVLRQGNKTCSEYVHEAKSLTGKLAN
jgi:hypothetical protein